MTDSVEPGRVDFKLDFYVKDFIASTLTMSGPESAAYVYSLCVAWMQGASLPADPERIRRAMRYDREEWARVWAELEPRWPLSDDGTKRVNKRLAREWEKAKERAKNATAKSQHGNKVRWDKVRSESSLGDSPGDPSGSPSGLAVPVPVPVLSLPTPKTLSKSEEVPARKARGTRTGFVPPALEEIRAYWTEKKLKGDPEIFFNHFSNAKWRLSGGKGAVMADWRLAAQNWSRNEPERKGGNGKILKTQADLDREAESRTVAGNREADSRARREQLEFDERVRIALEEKAAAAKGATAHG